MTLLERERLRAEQDPLDRAEPRLVAGHVRIARGAGVAAGPVGQRLPADAGEHAREVGVARHRHPRVVPDQVEDAALRAALGAGRRQRVGQRVAQAGSALVQVRRAGEDRRQLVDQRKVVDRIARMRDDDLRRRVAPRLDRVDRLLPVLVDIDQHVRGRQLAQLGQVHVLGTADLGDGADAIARVDAKPGAGDQAFAEAEREDQLGQAGHQARDARRRGVAGHHGGSAVAAPKQQNGTFRIKIFPQFTYIRQSVSGSRAFLK